MVEQSEILNARCGACDETIGQLVGGRFVHDSNCTQPQRIGGGGVKCCHCGGMLYPEAAGLETPPTGRRLRAHRT